VRLYGSAKLAGQSLGALELYRRVHVAQDCDPGLGVGQGGEAIAPAGGQRGQLDPHPADLELRADRLDVSPP
jgi:hypothetical protein